MPSRTWWPSGSLSSLDCLPEFKLGCACTHIWQSHVQAPHTQPVQAAAPGAAASSHSHPLVHTSGTGSSTFPVTQSPDPWLLSHPTSKNKSSQECLQIFTESDPFTAATALDQASTILTQTSAINGQGTPSCLLGSPSGQSSQRDFITAWSRLWSSSLEILPRPHEEKPRSLKWTTRPLSSPANLPAPSFHLLQPSFALSAPGTLGFSNLLSKFYLGPPYTSIPLLPESHYFHGLLLPPSQRASLATLTKVTP